MNKLSSDVHYSVSLSFEEIKLPPFQDIILIGKYSPQGKLGLAKSLELMMPNGFKLIEIEDEKVEAIFVSKKIIAKMPQETILDILKEKVFPFVSEGEMIKVDFKIVISYLNIEKTRMLKQ